MRRAIFFALLLTSATQVPGADEAKRLPISEPDIRSDLVKFRLKALDEARNFERRYPELVKELPKERANLQRRLAEARKFIKAAEQEMDLMEQVKSGSEMIPVSWVAPFQRKSILVVQVIGPNIVVCGTPSRPNQSDGKTKPNTWKNIDLIALKNWPTEGMVNGTEIPIQGMAFEAGTVTHTCTDGDKRIIPLVIRVPEEMITRTKPKSKSNKSKK